MPKGIIAFIVLVILACTGYYIYATEYRDVRATGLRPEISQDDSRQEEAYKNRVMDLRTYLNVHISEISPVQETLGGKFYVSDVQSMNGKGVVRYEDGHMQYVADFLYSGSDSSGYTISKFKIRDQ